MERQSWRQCRKNTTICFLAAARNQYANMLFICMRIFASSKFCILHIPNWNAWICRAHHWVWNCAEDRSPWNFGSIPILNSNGGENALSYPPPSLTFLAASVLVSVGWIIDGEQDVHADGNWRLHTASFHHSPLSSQVYINRPNAAGRFLSAPGRLSESDILS